MSEIRTFLPIRDCWYLTGSTASGKTSVGLELARRLGAEIISLDSMAIYRDLDIGTAKPTPEQQAAAPHHLIDIVDPCDEFSVPQYVAAAHEAVSEIRRRGREALFVGGTPLYLKALLRGVYPGPPADWDFRRQIDEELKTVPIAALHQRLEQIDPLSASRLHPHDKRRIIRALEVYRATGTPISHEQLQFEEIPRDRARVFVLQWPRPQLHQRIEARVERMFAAGLIDEAARLREKYGKLGRTAAQAVGYREAFAHLDGQQPLEKTIEQVKQRTRQFARRQETWFRSLPECRFLPLETGSESPEIVDRILASETP